MKNSPGRSLCVWTTNIRQPGSFTASAVSVRSSDAASVSFPCFATHVTARTSMAVSFDEPDCSGGDGATASHCRGLGEDLLQRCDVHAVVRHRPERPMKGRDHHYL